MIKRPRNRGFTLIELMVIASIISLLASILMANLVTAQRKARDVVRKSDLRQLRQALELYHLKHQFYPRGQCDEYQDDSGFSVAFFDRSNCSNNSWQKIEPDQTTPPGILDLVTDGQITALPLAPRNSAFYYIYLSYDCVTDNHCRNFNLIALLEGETEPGLKEQACWRDDTEFTGIKKFTISTGQFCFNLALLQ
jgi:prepilin-type N-terminal cleavage/methylation domain-containing protein